ncbi:hypothetical protein [Zavarzinella formosa]|uniref:hypothetical protein n=1 Tax=Zavarzinella formosa TaxID=360055 RepID=UPI0003185CBB|nr:hypothetical protein [Zavarzinella formosa]
MPRLIAGLTMFLGATSVFACTYCDPGSLKVSTLRQEARSAKVVVVVRPVNPRLVGEQGMTDLVVEQLLKNDSKQVDPKLLVLNRWIPVDARKPSRLLVFVDVTPQFDPYRGVPLRGTDVGGYLKEAMKLDDRDRNASLKFYFQYLDHADPDVASDAFLEFAKATDAEIADVCKHLEAAKIRQLLTNPKTPADRLGLYGFLLGATGTAKDVNVLVKLIRETDASASNALSGLLGGLISLDPKAGWQMTIGMISDEKIPYQHKLAAMGTLRFFQICQPKNFRPQILEGMRAIVRRGDMADMAVEDLRRWGWWDLSDEVLAQYGKPTHAAPLVKNSIIRYAITCRDTSSKEFLTRTRRTESTLVDEIEESLASEKPPPTNSKP